MLSRPLAISSYHSPVPSPLCPGLIFFLPYIPSKTELLAGKMVFHQYDKSCGLNLGTQIHYSSSLSRDPLDYVRLVINTTLGYGITASGEIGTLWEQYGKSIRFARFSIDNLVLVRALTNLNAQIQNMFDFFQARFLKFLEVIIPLSLAFPCLNCIPLRGLLTVFDSISPCSRACRNSIALSLLGLCSVIGLKHSLLKRCLPQLYQISKPPVSHSQSYLQLRYNYNLLPILICKYFTSNSID